MYVTGLVMYVRRLVCVIMYMYVVYYDVMIIEVGY